MLHREASMVVRVGSGFAICESDDDVSTNVTDDEDADDRRQRHTNDLKREHAIYVRA